MISHLGLYLKSCIYFWVCLYLTLCFLCGLPNLVLHSTGVGLLLCVVSYFRLSPPDPSVVLGVLGPDPRNFDGSPSKVKAGNWVVAHRGAGLDAPENTLAAIRLAKKNGAKCIEFDVSFTKDGVAVAFHDDTLERTTDGIGKIEDKTLEEVRKLDAAHNHIFKQDFSPEGIPTVDEFVQECLKNEIKMIVDLKSWKTPDQTVDYICDLYEKNPSLYGNAMISTFFPHLAYLIRRRDPKIVMGMAWRPYFLTYENYNGLKSESRPRFDAIFYHMFAVVGDVLLKWAVHELLWYFIGLSFVLIHKDYVTKEYLQNWREKGVRVMAWTVNTTPQRVYLTHYLRCTVLADSMDEIPLTEYISEEEAPGYEQTQQGDEVTVDPVEEEELRKQKLSGISL